MVRFAGLDSNNEFEAESVKDHIKNLAASAMDVSGLARREDVDSITQKIESGELKGEPGETVGVFGEADATLVDGTLTIDPNSAVVNVPRISGAVTVKIEDVDLPEGVTSDNGVQVTLRMAGVNEGAVINWPTGTITHDKSVPGKHVALLMRTDDHWEVYFPPTAAMGIDSEVLFGEYYPPLTGMFYDDESNAVVEKIIPIQQQISGLVFDESGEKLYFGAVAGSGEVAGNGLYAIPISDMVVRLWYKADAAAFDIEKMGKAVLDAESRQYDEEEKFLVPDPTRPNEYLPTRSIQKPATVVKEIDGAPHLVHWMPKWSTNMAKVLSGDMTHSEFAEQVESYPKPNKPEPTAVPFDPEHPEWGTYNGPPRPEDVEAYKKALKEWSDDWEVTPVAWEAYTVPIARNESLDVDTIDYSLGNQ